MDWFPAPKPGPKNEKREGGIALFMVIAALSVISIVVTEFTYVAQVNQKMAFDGLDQLKALYLAKTGFKLSLLRLKAYQQVKNYAASMVKAAGGGAAAQSMVPTSLLNMIWQQPIIYPLPTNLPGMTPSDKEKIEAFQKASSLEGHFSSVIESESDKFNLNSILAGYATQPSPSPSPSTSPGSNPSTAGTQPNPNPNAAPSATPSFNPQAARDQLKTYLQQILDPKMEEDSEFADAYRDAHLMDDLMDAIAGWADFTYQRVNDTGDIPMKRAPFYSVTELHMIPGMDDDLYNLFAPNLTVARTPGVNVNTMKDTTLKAFVPLATKDEIEKFFKDRDSEETDGTFKSEDDFYKYIQNNFQAYARGTTLDDLKKQFQQNNVHFVTDETEFKITVQASMNQSTRTIEAWVTLGSNQPSGGPSPSPTPAATVNLSGNGPSTTAPPDPGIKIHYMRVL
jgi:general secretion pathway protein K